MQFVANKQVMQQRSVKLEKPRMGIVCVQLARNADWKQASRRSCAVLKSAPKISYVVVAMKENIVCCMLVNVREAQGFRACLPSEHGPTCGFARLQCFG
jgi:hypothetical protein